MGIVDEDIARVRDTTDIVSLIVSRSPSNASGSATSGCALSPGEDAVLSVNPSLGLFTASRVRRVS